MILYQDKTEFDRQVGNRLPSHTNPMKIWYLPCGRLCAIWDDVKGEGWVRV